MFDFGSVSLTGVFLENGKNVEKAPIIFGHCSNCGLHQLMQNFQQAELYGPTYGYESHLNSQMRSHLESKAKLLEKTYLQPTNLRILDIASNDGTFLTFFSTKVLKYGIDPLIRSVGDYYPKESFKIIDFFSSKVVLGATNGQLFDLVTSNSVLYDVDSPVNFAKDVASVLNENGIWHFEQSYLPSMIDTMSIDTICHEHLLYLSASQINVLLEEAGFGILNVSLNEVNGGSIAITAIKSKNKYSNSFFEFLMKKEKTEGYFSDDKAIDFFQRSLTFRESFTRLLEEYIESGTAIFGVGASTKGNMLLQFCGLDASVISEIGEINPKKFGKQTPGSAIPISQESVLFDQMSKKKSIGVVFPWHFRNSIRKAAVNYISRGGALLYPLPRIEIESI